MAQIVVRQIPDEVHRALKARAVEHGRSAELKFAIFLRERCYHRPAKRQAIFCVKSGRVVILPSLISSATRPLMSR